MDLNNNNTSKKTYSNLLIDKKIMGNLTSYAFNQDIFRLPIDEFEAEVKQQLLAHNVKCDLIDVLFKPDESGLCLFVYLVNGEAKPLFDSILEKYKNEFKDFIPNEWEFMIWVNPNECHNSFTNFYGRNAIDKIVDMKTNVLYYSTDYFTKYYLQDKLDYFYTIDNMKGFNNILSRPIIHLLNFFEADSHGFKKFMMDNKSSNNLAFEKSDIFKLENLMFKHFSVHSINHYVGLFLPDAKEFDILVARKGNEKASKLISEFINFQHEYILSFNDHSDYSFRFEREVFKSLINADINFKNCGKALAFGLKRNPDIMSYLIINDIITKEDLLLNIEDTELKIKAEHNMLDKSLDKKTESPKRKVKL
jgi:hypothetical protein